MKWLLLIPFAVWALWLWRSAGYREVEQAVDPVTPEQKAAWLEMWHRDPCPVCDDTGTINTASTARDPFGYILAATIACPACSPRREATR